MTKVKVITCYNCGKEFVDGFAFKDDPKKIFCSKKCVDEYIEKTTPAQYCDECGKRIGNRYYPLPGTDKVFCSQKCGRKGIKRLREMSSVQK